MSTFSADFQAANGLTGYTLRFFNGQAHVTVTDGQAQGKASSPLGEPVAAKLALAALRSATAEAVEEAAVEAEAETDTPTGDGPTRSESIDLHPAGSDLPVDLPPPPFITGG